MVVLCSWLFLGCHAYEENPCLRFDALITTPDVVRAKNPFKKRKKPENPSVMFSLDHLVFI